MRMRTGQPSARRPLLYGAALAGVLLTLLLGAAPALAGARWRVTARPAPTQLPPEGQGFVDVLAAEAGSTLVSATASPVTITDTLPQGVTVTSVNALWQGKANFEFELAWKCSAPGTNEVKCTYNPSPIPPIERHPIAPYEDLELQIGVTVAAPAGRYQNSVKVEGGNEAQEAGGKLVEGGPVPGETRSDPFTVNGGATTFGVEEEGYSVVPEDENGLPDRRAGGHPFQLTTILNLNQTLEKAEATGEPLLPAAPALTRNLHFNLPPGMLGNVTAVPQCSFVEFSAIEENTNQCKEESAIGVARVTLEEPKLLTLVTISVPVFNLETQAGEPARFGFVAEHVPVILDTHVRTGSESGAAGGGDYGVEVSVSYATQLAQLLGSEVTLWGVPGDERHDPSRGWACVAEGRWVNHQVPCGPPKSRVSSAFLTLPTSCTSPLSTSVDGESWPFKKSDENGLGRISSLGATYDFPTGFEGCGALPFSPSIRLKPTSNEANTPTGLEVDVHAPQQGTLDGQGRAESAVKATTVTLPEGVQLNPSAANGLEACSEQQIGYQGEGKTDPYSPGASEPPRFSPTPANCPPASKVGTVKVKTPLLKKELEGAVYLAAQNANPFGSLVALYIAAEDPESGVRVKIAGEAKLDGVTGQITSTFVNTPQVPFEDFTVNFNSGPRASVTTPPLCGTYTTGASFTPWSTGVAQPSSSEPGEFTIGSGPGGSGCANPQPFAPAFTAGSTNLQAGAFTPFTLTIGRPDADQPLKKVSVTLPAGAAAMLASTTPCPEPQASNGTCGPDSLIGYATAVSGLGPDPYTVNGGRVYITGPYAGAPFGLSIVTPAVAGPFNLGNVVVRSTINVNPSTAVVTIGSTLPTIVQGVGMPSSGIPLALKQINVVVDRPGFEFNPTNCTPMAVTGTLGGAAGASATVPTPFQVANCSKLAFSPKLTASTQGNSSKANGASLVVKVTSTPGQANIAKTALILPIALPSRLTTIQKACVDSVFEGNPAACPEGSNIGTATVHTPVLKSPLTGPAYLVSHGGAAFPDVEFVLQGEGITLILDGQTNIKKGITSSTFNAVPDAPVTTFETTLPEGPHSALTANVPAAKKYSLCGAKLVMPTTITGQNGAVIKQETKIPVSGCKGVAGFTLAKALKACKKLKKKKKRVACEKKARKKYGPKKSKKKGKGKGKK